MIFISCRERKIHCPGITSATKEVSLFAQGIQSSGDVIPEVVITNPDGMKLRLEKVYCKNEPRRDDMLRVMSRGIEYQTAIER